MQKHLLLFVLAIALSALTGLHAQNSCLPDGITFTSQAQIDSFPMNYPGCTVIGGDVVVQEKVAGDLIHLDSLYPITSIEGSLEIGVDQIYPFPDGNSSLNDLGGLQHVTSIGGYLSVWGNQALTDLHGLESLTSVGGYLSVWENITLGSLGGLENLTSVEGYLSIYDNDALNSLTGLQGLTTIGGNFVVRGNDALTNLSGLDQVSSIGGGFFVSINALLVSLDGLEGLTAIGGELRVDENSSLSNLEGLRNLASATIANLRITDNPHLSICHIQPICDYLSNGGPATIDNNAPGCNTPQEVEDACQPVSVDDLLFEDAIQLFPNPSSGLVQIEAPAESAWKVSVRDAMGRMVVQPHELVDGAIDLSALPAGVYFVELNDGGQMIGRRIVKQ